MTVCPAKTQISLGFCPVRSESSLCVQWVAKVPTYLHVDSEDSDQTRRMQDVGYFYDYGNALFRIYMMKKLSHPM